MHGLGYLLLFSTAAISTSLASGESATATASDSTTSQGSLASLLSRISEQNSKALPVNSIPTQYKSPPRNASGVTSNPKNHLILNPKKGQGKKPSLVRRWVWGTSIIQDGATGVPPAGTNVNGFNTYPVNTPTASLAMPTFPARTTTRLAVIPTSTVLTKPTFYSKSTKLLKVLPTTTTKAKRFYWGESILEDPGVTPLAEGTGMGGGIAANPHATPTMVIAPPSFHPAAPPAPIFSAASPNVTTSPAAPVQAANPAPDNMIVAAKLPNGAVARRPPVNPKYHPPSVATTTGPIKIVTTLVPHPGEPTSPPWKTHAVEPSPALQKRAHAEHGHRMLVKRNPIPKA